MPVFNFARQVLAGVRRLAQPGDDSRFWIGQIMVIASTILGVYLAANAGFERAVEFDAIVNQRSSYHLLTALEAELSDNIAINDNLCADLRQANIDIKYMLRRAPMGKFVWHAMLESDQTFLIPHEIITGVRRYYNKVDVLRGELGERKIRVVYFIARIKQEHESLAKVVLPVLTKEKDALEQVLGQLR